MKINRNRNQMILFCLTNMLVIPIAAASTWFFLIAKKTARSTRRREKTFV